MSVCVCVCEREREGEREGEREADAETQRHRDTEAQTWTATPGSMWLLSKKPPGSLEFQAVAGILREAAMTVGALKFQWSKVGDSVSTATMVSQSRM